VTDQVKRQRGFGTHPWQIAIAAVFGLLVANVVGGLVALALNRSVHEVTDEAVRYDVELEDRGDDLRVAVLDVRHYHRNIAFGSPSRGAVADFERAYAALHEEIDDLEQLDSRGADVATSQELRQMAEAYYAEFRPAVDRFEIDPAGFTRASDHGLVSLAALEQAAAIDRLGEQRAAAALHKVEEVTAAARLVLLGVLAGLFLVGAGLAYAALRVVRELRELYARQQEAAKAAEVASQAKTDFIADVSHELRTPLTVLRGNAEVGLELERNCVHAPMLQDIVNESASMARMVEDLLFLARSDSASPPLELEVVALGPFLAGLAGRAEVLARERGATFEAALDGEGWLQIDPARIEQAVLILVDNSAKYSPSGGLISLSSWSDRRELHIQVSDRGPGIPEADLPHIFERFYRVDKVRGRKQGGAGLGLSIAKTTAEAHGGRIEATSHVGQGTRMTIHLPLFEASAADKQPLARSSVEDAR
jgi:two-component system sensor histidine kinase VicK